MGPISAIFKDSRGIWATLPGFGMAFVPREPDPGEPERGGNGAERHFVKKLSKYGSL